MLDSAGVEAAGVLRGHEYVVRRKWRSPNVLTPSGAEFDQYDRASTQFAVLDTAAGGEVTAEATVRFIEANEATLPLQQIFPELSGAAEGATEISRYIAQSAANAHAMRAVIVAHLLEHDVLGVAVISRGLRRLLERQGLVVRQIGAPRSVDQYGKIPQIAVEVDAEASASEPAMAGLVDLALAHDWDGVLRVAYEMAETR